MALKRKISKEDNPPKKTKRTNEQDYPDDIDLEHIEDPDITTRRLLIDLEDFVVKHYIAHISIFSLLLKKRIITEEEFKEEKKQVEKVKEIQSMINNVLEHKKIVEEEDV